MMEVQSWIVEEIKPEMLPEPYRKLCSVIGVINIISLAELFQGTTVYFPKLDVTLKSIRNARIRAEFNGGNVAELALKYNLTEVWVRNILQDILPDENQGVLF